MLLIFSMLSLRRSTWPVKSKTLFLLNWGKQLIRKETEKHYLVFQVLGFELHVYMLRLYSDSLLQLIIKTRKNLLQYHHFR